MATQIARRLGRAELTAREREVLQLMGEGFSNKELAYELGMAETTTEKHVSSVLQKLGARDRIQAVRLALERGLLDSTADGWNPAHRSIYPSPTVLRYGRACARDAIFAATTKRPTQSFRLRPRVPIMGASV